jgi:hypothetical protein
MMTAEPKRNETKRLAQCSDNRKLVGLANLQKIKSIEDTASASAAELPRVFALHR